MRKLTAMLLLGSTLLASAAVAASLDAPDNGSSGSMMGRGTMGDDDGGGMMGMMKMMKQMSQMVDRCNGMMSDSRPNDQWRKNAPTEPDQRG
jgi:hypothetical protein